MNHEQQQQQATAPVGNVADLERQIAALAAAMVVRRNLIAQLQAGNDSDQLAQNALFAELAEATGGVVLNLDGEAGSVRAFACSRLTDLAAQTGS